jgi:hypothetical protein
MIPVVYHTGFNVRAFGLGRLHPFDIQKYRRIHDALIERGLRWDGGFVRPRAATCSEISS